MTQVEIESIRDDRANNWRTAVVFMMGVLVLVLGFFVAIVGLSVAQSLDNQEKILAELSEADDDTLCRQLAFNTWNQAISEILYVSADPEATQDEINVAIDRLKVADEELRSSRLECVPHR